MAGAFAKTPVFEFRMIKIISLWHWKLKFKDQHYLLNLTPNGFAIKQ